MSFAKKYHLWVRVFLMIFVGLFYLLYYKAGVMSVPCILRQLEERHVHSEAEIMVWSPKMDLIAIAHVQGKLDQHQSC